MDDPLISDHMDPLEDSSCWDFLDCSFFPDADNLINPSLDPLWPPNDSRQSFYNTLFCILSFLFSFPSLFVYTKHGFRFICRKGSLADTDVSAGRVESEENDCSRKR